MKQELVGIYSMWKREVIRFARSPSRIIGSLGMPFFMLAILGTGLNGVMSLPEANGNYLQFITPGILGMVLMFASVFSGVTIIFDKQFGFLKETLVAPVSRASIVLGKSFGGATAAVFQGLLMLGLAILLGVSVNPANLVLGLAVMVLISLSFVSLGIAIASFMDDPHGFQLIMNFLVMPMFFLSGALFPLSSAPEIVRTISLIDPLTYGVEALRYIFLGSSSIPLMESIGVLVAFNIATVLAAAYLFSKIES